MKQAGSFFKYILFWLFVFFIERITFFVYHFDKIKTDLFEEYLLIFAKGLWLDLSMVGYFLLLPILLLILNLFISKKNIINNIINIYSTILLVFIIILGIIDLNIYSEWGTKINSRAIEFLILSPGEAMASSASSPLLSSFIIILIQFITCYYVYRKIGKFEFFKENILLQIISIPFFAFLSIMMLRGGLKLSPINQSAVYFSNKNAVNHAALNTEWNLMHSVIENHFSTDNPYVFMPDEEAQHILDSLYDNKNQLKEKILINDRPNIIFIILESYTSDIVEAFGGEKNVSPFINKYASSGLSFSNIYASGDRTDKGMIAILSGFPTQAVRTIIQQPDKFEKLPAIPKSLSSNGYSTAFYYGGESEFANFKSYLISTQFEKIIDKNNFESNQMNSKWGAHDGFLFDKALEDMRTLKEPFMSTILTLSSHEPFEVPIPNKFKGDDLPSKFRKAANYTDLSFGEFMAKAEKEKWYKNTLFIVVADHGHRLPKEYDNAYDHRKFRIPLFFYGDVINKKYNSKIVDKIGSQTDIASTLLKQMDISDTAFHWSSNLLNNTNGGFAFYSYDNGIGWVDDENIINVDNVRKEIIYQKIATSNLDQKKKVVQAYMQKVFKTYLNY